MDGGKFTLYQKGTKAVNIKLIYAMNNQTHPLKLQHCVNMWFCCIEYLSWLAQAEYMKHNAAALKVVYGQLTYEYMKERVTYTVPDLIGESSEIPISCWCFYSRVYWL